MALMLATGSWTAMAAGDPDAGAEKAGGCASCHGADGNGRIPLAGKDADYLAEQLRDYRSGARQHGMMNTIARQLTDEDIADLAAWFAAQAPK